jgi:hypothetical protein
MSISTPHPIERRRDAHKCIYTAYIKFIVSDILSCIEPCNILSDGVFLYEFDLIMAACGETSASDEEHESYDRDDSYALASEAESISARCEVNYALPDIAFYIALSYLTTGTFL